MSSTESNSSSSLKVLFIPVDHWGHINPCIGMAEALLALGHRPFIALEQSWRGRITSLLPGLEEALYVDPTRTADRSSAKANEHWLENLKSRTASFPLEGIEKLKAVCANRQYNSSRLYILLNVNEELRRIIGELKPDVILVDCFSTVPAVYHSKVPWIRVFSGGPLRFLPDSDELLPPPASGKTLCFDDYFNSKTKHFCFCSPRAANKGRQNRVERVPRAGTVSAAGDSAGVS